MFCKSKGRDGGMTPMFLYSVYFHGQSVSDMEVSLSF